MTKSSFLLLSAVLCVGTANGQSTLLVPAQFATIQAAINAATNGDTVLVSPGTYHEAVDYLGKEIGVASVGGATVTTLTGLTSVPSVTFQTGEGSSSSLSGFTLSGGYAGILCSNASPTVANCVILNHSRTDGTGGAGIRCTSNGVVPCSPSFLGCRIQGNVAAFGGGVAVDGPLGATSMPFFSGCRVASNFAYAGGGGGFSLRGEGAAVSIFECTITGNGTAATGGGIDSDDLGSLTITNSRIEDNVAPGGSGAAFVLRALSGSVTNAMVTGNSGTGPPVSLGVPYPGAINTTTIRNCTFTANQSTGGSTGGIALTEPSVIVTIGNSILWGNSGLDLYVTPGLSALISVSYCDVGLGVYLPGAGIIGADPLFVDPSTGDFHLSRFSPCRNASNPVSPGLPPSDIDGGARLEGFRVDLGADEIAGITFPGTGERLDLYAFINGGGDPLGAGRAGPAGATLRTLLKSPGGNLTGAVPLLAGEIYATGSPLSANLAGIWLDGNAFIIAGSLPAGIFTAPGLAADGLSIVFQIPPGLGGVTLRLQGFVTSPFATNGVYASSNALEVAF